MSTKLKFQKTDKKKNEKKQRIEVTYGLIQKAVNKQQNSLK